jgi:type III restriction enzyme
MVEGLNSLVNSSQHGNPLVNLHLEMDYCLTGSGENLTCDSWSQSICALHNDIQTRCKDGAIKNLMIEISGFSKDKAEKKWFVENRWIPAVNALKDKNEYPEWHSIEIGNDIRNIKNQLIERISSI